MPIQPNHPPKPPNIYHLNIYDVALLPEPAPAATLPEAVKESATFLVQAEPGPIRPYEGYMPPTPRIPSRVIQQPKPQNGNKRGKRQ